jgi:hypothetical protein
VRVTEARLARLSDGLTGRDREIIETLDRLRLASAKQLERLHFDGSPRSRARSASRVLTRLVEIQVITRLDRQIGGVRSGSAGFVYALGAAGQRLASVTGPAGGRRIRRPWTPGAPFVDHQLAVSELFVRLREAERAGSLEVLDFDAEPLCWRVFSGAGGSRAILKPDAFVRVASDGFEHFAFIEVDRATQSAPTISRKLAGYRRYVRTGREQTRWGLFPAVLLLAPSEGRKSVLVDVAADQPEDSWPLFAVAAFDQAPEALMGRRS